ncbi:hypothetical protein [Spirosoma flavus]
MEKKCKNRGKKIAGIPDIRADNFVFRLPSRLIRSNFRYLPPRSNYYVGLKRINQS